MCMNVDLPEPEGPVTARNSPDSTSRLTPRRAFTWISPTTYVFTRLRTEITGISRSNALTALRPRLQAPGVVAYALDSGLLALYREPRARSQVPSLVSAGPASAHRTTALHQRRVGARRAAVHPLVTDDDAGHEF